MGFFSKLFGGGKEKPKCPICGNEMGFFSKTELADGAICDKCVARAKSLIGNRLIAEMSVDAVKAVIAEEDEVNAKLVAAFGAEYPNFFKTVTAFPFSPKATDVGIARAKAMKNGIAAQGFIVSGAFDKGTVTVIRGGKTHTAELVETVPYDDSGDLEQITAAHLYKGPVKAGKYAWLIFAEGSDVSSGDLIGSAT